jgi:hypothetical protein
MNINNGQNEKVENLSQNVHNITKTLFGLI